MPTQAVRVVFPWHKTESSGVNGKMFYRWRPGIRWEDGSEDREAVADGEGAMVLAEVGRYTPPGFSQRVFYTRQFVLPSGEAVGRPRLKVMGAAGFTRLCRGYRYPYELVDALATVEMEPDFPEAEDFADAESY